MMLVHTHATPWVKRLGLGVLWYQVYHQPRQWVQRCRQQGITSLARLAWARWQMIAAARQLPPLPLRSGSAIEIHFLSGHRFWYQTVFCFYSLAQQTDLNLRLVVWDDGTLTAADQRAIQSACPQVRFVLTPEIQARLDQVLPIERYPYLRSRRQEYPNLRKLTDIHAGATGWNLVLDSDMLFFRPPQVLLDWLRQPQAPCHMVDVETAYGYSPELMTQLAGCPVPERINVGICGLRSDQIDWDTLEQWCRLQIEQEGSHYYQEQALTALLMASQPCIVMPAQDYILMPDESAIAAPQGVMHHYVADSKPGYFQMAWKHVTPPQTGEGAA